MYVNMHQGVSAKKKELVITNEFVNFFSPSYFLKSIYFENDYNYKGWVHIFVLPKGRYVKPCNKSIAFHFSMITRKYALNPY